MTNDSERSAPPPPRGPGRAAPAHLEPLREADFLSPSPERQAALSDEIDRYFNTPLPMFPFAETRAKPDRFYDFYEQGIAERFPDDEDIRALIGGYSRGFFHSLLAYMAGKRLMLIAALAALFALAMAGPGAFTGLGVAGPMAVAAAAAAMALVYGVFAGVNALVFVQYRISLENRSYELSRQIIQRTRELQNLYASLRAAPDQDETHYQDDGDGWGARSGFLVRLLMWVAQRMDFLERFIQVEMWRVRRERYWINWAGGFLVVLIMAVFAVAFALRGGDASFRVLQLVGSVVAAALAWSSYHFWKTPLNLARDKLGAESWVRYATLDLDNTIADQVSRDKKRLVEYRTLNKAR